MKAGLNDHFGPLAQTYARFRPNYPPALFDWLARRVPSHQLAWDCATGNGQAAIHMAHHFDAVVATDISPEQLAHATADPRVEYRCAPAECSGLAAGSVDLICVAQALHWFALDDFYAEARRVLKPGGLLAAWSYGRLHLTEPASDEVVQRFYDQDIGPYWPAERIHVENGLRDLPFPFEPIAVPAFALSVQWSLAQLIGYLRSWSATRRFIEVRGFDPVEAVAHEMAAIWGGAARTQEIRWPLSFKLGR